MEERVNTGGLVSFVHKNSSGKLDSSDLNMIHEINSGLEAQRHRRKLEKVIGLVLLGIVLAIILIKANF